MVLPARPVGSGDAMLRAGLPMNALARKIRTIRGLPAAELKLALRVIGLMAVVRLALWTLPFRSVKARAENVGISGVRRADGTTPGQVAWAVKLAAKYIPEASCLTQALTAQIMLNRCGIQNRFHVGVVRDSARRPERKHGFEAHAWVECCGRVLVGGAGESARYAPILTVENPGRAI